MEGRPTHRGMQGQQAGAPWCAAPDLKGAAVRGSGRFQTSRAAAGYSMASGRATAVASQGAAAGGMGANVRFWTLCMMSAVAALALVSSHAHAAGNDRQAVVVDSTGSVSGGRPDVVYDSQNGVSGGAPATTYETAPFKNDRVTGNPEKRDKVVTLKPGPKGQGAGVPATPATPATPAKPAGDDGSQNNPNNLPFVPYINVTPGQYGGQGGGTSGTGGAGTGLHAGSSTGLRSGSTGLNATTRGGTGIAPAPKAPSN